VTNGVPLDSNALLGELSLVIRSQLLFNNVLECELDGVVALFRVVIIKELIKRKICLQRASYFELQALRRVDRIFFGGRFHEVGFLAAAFRRGGGLGLLTGERG
jgi:hypothetical protein